MSLRLIDLYVLVLKSLYIGLFGIDYGEEGRKGKYWRGGRS
ncbi:MAG: hypothetical protein Q8P57_05410 [Candidatus Pacearchaeota archaeon]|nr:hypothetical protein [Candidatus Pacearchaeota archaeon]